MDAFVHIDAKIGSVTVEFAVVNDEEYLIFEAVVGDTEIGGLAYNIAGSRIVLLRTSVDPEYRNQGIGTELVRRVLDDARTHGRTVTVLCPVVRAFIDDNPSYVDLVDATHPGMDPGNHHP